MKILHFHPDGRMATQFILPLIEAEQGMGHESLLVTDKNPKENSLRIAYDISLRNLITMPLAFFKILRLINDFRPDVVISHNTKSSLLPLLAARMMHVGVRVYFNHGVPYIGYTGLLRAGLRLFERWNCCMATHVITVSVDMIKLLQDVVSEVRPTLVSKGSACGLDLNIYSAERFKDHTWRTQNHFRDDETIVVFVGRPEKRKGFVDALCIWRDYINEPRCKLVLCGAQVDDVLKYFPEVPKNVVCLGFVKNIPEILSNADVLILPSLHEGLSYATLEAMACGAIVMANDIPGIRCLVENGVTGYLIQGNSLEEYAKLILAISSGEINTNSLREQARKKVESFSREKFLPQYLALLEDFLAKE